MNLSEFTSEEQMISCLISHLLAKQNKHNITFPTGTLEFLPNAGKTIEEGLLKRVSEAVTSALHKAFLEYLNELDVLNLYLENKEAEELSGYRKQFLDLLSENSFLELKNRIPGIMDLIDATCSQYDAFIDEMISRLKKDRKQISKDIFQGKQFECVTGLTVDCGDIHNFGRSTTIITTDRGKFVYKPHDIRIDSWAQELVFRFFSDIMKAPRVCLRDGYGYTEFITNCPADTEAEAKKYFYNLGGLCAVVLMLGSSDLHHHNVLSEGSYPVIIDYELMLRPGKNFVHGSIAEELNFSLLYSSLMPSRNGNGEMSILFAKDSENIGSPNVDGKLKNVLDYKEDFFAGFRRIYRRCLERKNELKAFVDTAKEIPIRHIYRDTAAYSNLLEKTRDKNWLGDPELPAELFKQLSRAMKKKGVEDAQEIAQAETDAILRGDIPYAYTKADTLDLYMDSTKVYGDIFHQSCIDNVKARLDYMSPADMEFEISLLKKAGSRVMKRFPCRTYLPVKISRDKTISDEKLIAKAQELASEILDDIVITPRGNLCLFGPDYFHRTGMELLDMGMMNGMTGICVFLSAVYTITDDEELKEQIGKTVQHYFRRLEQSMDGNLKLDVLHTDRESIGFSSGLAGKLMGCLLIGRYMQDAHALAVCEKIISCIKITDLRYEGTDVISGLAGLLKVLCSFDELYMLDGAEQLCTKLSDLLLGTGRIGEKGLRLWKTLSADWAVSGAGHGQSGIATALTLAGRRLCREDLIREAADGFAFEDHAYLETKHAWPDLRANDTSTTCMAGYCNGAPGIGINMLQLTTETGEKQKEPETGILQPDSEKDCLQYGNELHESLLERAIDSALQEPLLYKDFLCCGNSAVIDFLLEAGRRKKSPELKLEARSRMAMVLERAQVQGHFNCVNKSYDPVFSPNLFYGTAGIGYEMLRLTAPEKFLSLLL